MKGLFALLLIGLLGCGGNPRRSLTVSLNSTPLAVSGFVSTVQLGKAATNLGSNSVVTIVTFLPTLPQNFPTFNMIFCGNVVSQFIPNTFTTVDFTQGVGCSTITTVAPVTFVSIGGIVSIVQVTMLANNSLVTLVTFLSQPNGVAESVAFCGNVGNEFVLNTFMTVNFTQGLGCATVVSAITV